MQIHTSKVHYHPTLNQHTFTLHVTQEHIDKARRWQRYFQTLPPQHPNRAKYPAYCPIAMALKATGRFKKVSVTLEAIFTSDATMKHLTKDKAARIIDSFDLCINNPVPVNENIRPATITLLVTPRNRLNKMPHPDQP